MNFMDYLDEIERIARHHFRRHHDADEMIDRVRTKMWEEWVKLEDRGILTDHYVRMQLSFTIRAVKAGRRLEGANRQVDALDHKADEDFRVVIGSDDLDPIGTVIAKDLLEYYRGTLKDRDRQILERMLEGADSGELVRMFGVGQARISQKRRQFFEEMTILGEPNPAARMRRDFLGPLLNSALCAGHKFPR
ncbi:MAG TPA: hypothetical protein VFT74_09440 [Isosphaeraceae bacterium]|nr:hypothetical protein [Isosphaeraceae bacterium]